MIDYQLRAQRLSRNAIKLDHAVSDAEDFELELDFTSAIRRYREAAKIIDDQIALLALQLDAEREAGRVCSRPGCGGPTARRDDGQPLCALHLRIACTGARAEGER